MSQFEGIIFIALGALFLAWGFGILPADPEQRRNLEIKLPIIKNKAVVFALGGLMSAFGLLAALGFIK